MPVDLNNLFVSYPNPLELVEEAERRGFPRSMCAWVKGIYGAVRRFQIETVVGVVQGDCSNTSALMEVLSSEGVEVIPFSFPYTRSGEDLKREIARLAVRFRTTIEEAERWREKLLPLRRKLRRLDEMTWKETRISGLENHIWLVSSSDFEGAPAEFERRLDTFLEEASSRPPEEITLRLGYVGVPPISSRIYDFIEDLGGEILWNETQRQFSMPYDPTDLVDQYLRYTYPYGIFARLEDIMLEVRRRRLRGIIHYVQSFCFRSVEDRLLREALREENVAVLTLEGDRPGPFDERTKTRVEAFVDMVMSSTV